jgi:NAD kinase
MSTTISPLVSKPEARAQRGEGRHGVFMIDSVPISRADPEQRIEILRSGFPADIVTELASSMRWSRDHALAVSCQTVHRDAQDQDQGPPGDG